MKRLTLVVVGVAWMWTLSSLGCGGIDAGSAVGDDAASAIGNDAGSVVSNEAGSDESAVPGADSGFAGLDAATAEAGLSPAVRSGCETLCGAEVDAGCTGQSSLSQCLIGCAVLLGNPNCAAQSSELLSCAQGATMSCDSSGNVVIQGCGLSELAAESCVLTNATDPTLGATCTQYCANVASAHCSDDADAGCVQGCEMVGTLVASCSPSWTGYVNCAESASMTCGSDGKAGANACLGQYLQFVACFAQGMSTLVGDGG
jgi:hypothetical protein